MPDGRQKHNSHVNKNIFTKGPAKAVKPPALKEKLQSWGRLGGVIVI